MDERNVANWVGGAAVGLVLAAITWLLVFSSPGTGGGSDQVRVSDPRVARNIAARHRPLDQMQSCIDAAAARSVSGCAAASFAPSMPPTPSDRRVQRSTDRGAVGPGAPSVPVVAPSAPTSPPPATPQPSTSPPASTPPPQPTQHPASTQQPVSHTGPVPGGNTNPPHTGPRP